MCYVLDTASFFANIVCSLYYLDYKYGTLIRHIYHLRDTNADYFSPGLKSFPSLIFSFF